MLRASIREDQGSARGRVGGSVGPAQAVEHQFTPVVELHAEPIPSDLFVAEIPGTEFVIDPAPQVTGFRAGLAETGAADSLGIPKPGLAMIRQGEMGEVQMSDRPAGRIRSGARLLDAPAEERQLISEPATVLRREMAGVVPPFGPELIVSTVVVREAIRVARHSRT